MDPCFDTWLVVMSFAVRDRLILTHQCHADVIILQKAARIVLVIAT